MIIVVSVYCLMSKLVSKVDYCLDKCVKVF